MKESDKPIQFTQKHEDLLLSNSKNITKLDDKVENNTGAIAKLDEKVDKNTNAIQELNKKVDKNTNAIEKLDKKVEKNGELIQDLKTAVEENKELIHKQGILDEERDTKIDLILEVSQHMKQRFEEQDLIKEQLTTHDHRIAAVESHISSES